MRTIKKKKMWTNQSPTASCCGKHMICELSYISHPKVNHRTFLCRKFSTNILFSLMKKWSTLKKWHEKTKIDILYKLCSMRCRSLWAVQNLGTLLLSFFIEIKKSIKIRIISQRRAKWSKKIRTRSLKILTSFKK